MGNLLSHNTTLAAEVRPAQLLLQNITHPGRHSLAIQDTHVVSLNNLVTDKTDEEENEIENVAVVNTSTQTDIDSSDIPEVVDTSMRIKELEAAVLKAKEGERAARAEIIRKDIELSKATINAQKKDCK